MEQPCHRCGQAVEEGVPFCPHCSAPQIRVVIAEPVPVPTASPDAAAGQPGSGNLPASQTVPVLALPMEWSQAVKPCALAALVASLLMVLGLNPLVAMLSVGFLAVVLYRQRRPGAVVRAGIGGRLGAFSGLLSFGITALLAALAAMAPDFRTKMRSQIIENAQKWAGSHPGDPQVQAALEQLKTPQGLVMMLIVGGVLLLLLSMALGGLGGALGGAILGRRHRP